MAVTFSNIRLNIYYRLSEVFSPDSSERIVEMPMVLRFDAVSEQDYCDKRKTTDNSHNK